MIQAFPTSAVLLEQNQKSSHPEDLQDQKFGVFSKNTRSERCGEM